MKVLKMNIECSIESILKNDLLEETESILNTPLKNHERISSYPLDLMEKICLDRGNKGDMKETPFHRLIEDVFTEKKYGTHHR
jgi:hypothetical protein